MKRALYAILLFLFFCSFFCDASGNSIVLVEKSGDVSLWNAGSRRWEDVSAKSALREGAFIKTGEGDSSAIISFGEKAVITLSENTVIRITVSLFAEDGIKEMKIQLPRGKVWAAVEQLPAPGSKFEIETPNASAGIRGTVFTSGYFPEDRSTRVGVVTGEVVVSSTLVAGEVVLRENMSTVVIANAPPVSPRVLEERERLEWERWKNNIPFSQIGIVGGIAEISAIQTQEASRIVRELGIARRGSQKVLQDFTAIEAAIRFFYADTRQVPARLNDLLEAPDDIQGWRGPYLGAGTNFIDPYGRPYQYRQRKTPGGRDYLELSTFGLVGAAGDTHGQETKLIFVDKLGETLQE